MEQNKRLIRNKGINRYVQRLLTYFEVVRRGPDGTIMRSESENSLNGWIAEHANRMTESRRESVAINEIRMFEMKRKERKRRKGRARR